MPNMQGNITALLALSMLTLLACGGQDPLDCGPALPGIMQDEEGSCLYKQLANHHRLVISQKCDAAWDVRSASTSAAIEITPSKLKEFWGDKCTAGAVTSCDVVIRPDPNELRFQLDEANKHVPSIRNGISIDNPFMHIKTLGRLWGVTGSLGESPTAAYRAKATFKDGFNNNYCGIKGVGLLQCPYFMHVYSPAPVAVVRETNYEDAIRDGTLSFAVHMSVTCVNPSGKMPTESALLSIVDIRIDPDLVNQ